MRAKRKLYSTHHFTFCFSVRFYYSNIRNFTETQSKTSDEVYKTAEDNTSNSVSLQKQESVDASLNSITMSPMSTTKNLPIRNDGAIDYDGMSSREFCHFLSFLPA